MALCYISIIFGGKYFGLYINYLTYTRNDPKNRFLKCTATHPGRGIIYNLPTMRQNITVVKLFNFSCFYTGDL